MFYVVLQALLAKRAGGLPEFYDPPACKYYTHKSGQQQPPVTVISPNHNGLSYVENAHHSPCVNKRTTRTHI